MDAKKSIFKYLPLNIFPIFLIQVWWAEHLPRWTQWPCHLQHVGVDASLRCGGACSNRRKFYRRSVSWDTRGGNASYCSRNGSPIPRTNNLHARQLSNTHGTHREAMVRWTARRRAASLAQQRVRPEPYRARLGKHLELLGQGNGETSRWPVGACSEGVDEAKGKARNDWESGAFRPRTPSQCNR